MSVAQGLGFVMRQVTDVMMTEEAALALRDIMSTHGLQQHQRMLENNMEEAVKEMSRVSAVLGSALNKVAASALENDRQTISAMQDLSLIHI